MRQTPAVLLLLLAATSMGCEGFKRLLLYNDADTTAKVTFKRETPPVNGYGSEDDAVNGTTDRSIVYLPPDSAYVLHIGFGSMMFNTRIREEDIRINYLKIETKNDTIIASSKSEVIALIKDKRTKYDKRKDKDKGLIKGRNFGNIMIRE